MAESGTPACASTATEESDALVTYSSMDIRYKSPKTTLSRSSQDSPRAKVNVSTKERDETEKQGDAGQKVASDEEPMDTSAYLDYINTPTSEERSRVRSISLLCIYLQSQ